MAKLDLQMHTVAPLGALTFQVKPRQLPPIQTITPASSALPSDTVQQVLQIAQSRSDSTASVLIEVHDQLQQHLREEGRNQLLSIAFNGVETGNVTVTVVQVETAEEASITGLEGSAKSGKGWGIQTFPQSQAPPYTQNNVLGPKNNGRQLFTESVLQVHHVPVPVFRPGGVVNESTRSQTITKNDQQVSVE